MNKVYVTGDWHGDFRGRANKFIYKTLNYLDKDDYLIVCGDFGIWDNSVTEKLDLDQLSYRCKFTILFVDGNHDNFDILNNMPVEDWNGGKIHRIRDNIIHLMRGYVFNICDKKFFTFGGAQSHDIDDGILELNDPEFFEKYEELCRTNAMFRINHKSWWKEELPFQEEMNKGLENLDKNNWEVDFVISHCCPQKICSVMSHGSYKPDIETLYFQRLLDKGLKFSRWDFGHYHKKERIMDRFYCHYYDIERIV